MEDSIDEIEQEAVAPELEEERMGENGSSGSTSSSSTSGSSGDGSKEPKGLMQAEEKVTGAVKWKTYMDYMKSVGSPLLLVMALLSFAIRYSSSSSSSSSSSVVVRITSDAHRNNQHPPSSSSSSLLLLSATLPPSSSKVSSPGGPVTPWGRKTPSPSICQV